MIYMSPERLTELERFAELGRMSASLLHEINNPLTAAMLWLDQCNLQQSPHLRHVNNSIHLLHRYVESARQQVRQESRCRSFCVQSELDQVRHILTALARRRGVKLYFASLNGCSLYGDPVKFQQIIANLIRNAIDSYEDASSAANKPVRLSLSTCDRYLTIRVSDRGCGIDREQLPQMFRPFYSTKGAEGRGLGIGLFAVKQSVETDFRGTIEVKSSKLEGTLFTVRLLLQASG